MGQLTLEELERITSTHDKFKEELENNGGSPPQIETYLRQESCSMQVGLLWALGTTELDHRRRSGEAPSREEYEGRFWEPRYKPAIDLLFPEAASGTPGETTPHGSRYEILDELGRG